MRQCKLDDILDGTKIRFVHGTVDQIDLGRRRVSVAEAIGAAAGRSDLAYDYLAYDERIQVVRLMANPDTLKQMSRISS